MATARPIPTTQRTRDQIMPEVAHDQIKVIGAGFGRTGTQSLREALNILGLKCYHMQDVKKNMAGEAPKWLDLLSQDSNDREWDNIFKPNHHEATVDFPSSAFYKEQMLYYPNAKVILTVRSNADVWYQSTFNSIYQMSKYPHESMFYKYIVRNTDQGKRDFMDMTDSIIWGEDGLFQAKFESDPEWIKKVYNDWIEEVKRSVPKDKLLILDLKKNAGQWEPLCEFLGVPVPANTPFPFSNKTKDKQNELERLKAPERKFYRAVAFTATLVSGALAAAGYRYYTSKSQEKKS